MRKCTLRIYHESFRSHTALHYSPVFPCSSARPNVYGCKHPTASVNHKQLTQEEIEEAEKAQEQLLKDLTHKMTISQSKNSAAIHDLVDESDIENWSTEENDIRDSRQGWFLFE